MEIGTILNKIRQSAFFRSTWFKVLASVIAIILSSYYSLILLHAMGIVDPLPWDNNNSSTNDRSCMYVVYQEGGKNLASKGEGGEWELTNDQAEWVKKNCPETIWTTKAEEAKKNTKVEETNTEMNYVSHEEDVVNSLASCTSEAFTEPPIKLDKLISIVPLGNLNPPGHTTPSDHIYWSITRKSMQSKTDIVDIFAPGNITINKVGQQTHKQNGKVINVDYDIEYALCRELTGRFGHVSELGPQFKDVKFDQCDSYAGGPGEEYTKCSSDTQVKVQAGEVIGTAGGKNSSALDMWMEDSRLPDPPMAGSFPSYDLKATCAVDYYSSELRDKLLKYFGGWNMDRKESRTVEPLCGQWAQDKAGTLQGNWHKAGGDRSDWSIALSLVHDFVNPGIGAVSVGGQIAEAGVWEFTPTHSGTINREFSEVTPGDKTYCYTGKSKAGKFLVQLVDADNLKIEHRQGSCSANEALSRPTNYQR